MNLLTVAARLFKIAISAIMITVGSAFIFVGLVVFDLVSTTGQGGISTLIPSLCCMGLGGFIILATMMRIRHAREDAPRREYIR